MTLEDKPHFSENDAVGGAHRNLHNSPNFVGYARADLEHLPFRSGSLDVTCSLWVMGHLPPEVKR
jgi:hypothetical protein